MGLVINRAGVIHTADVYRSSDRSIDTLFDLSVCKQKTTFNNFPFPISQVFLRPLSPTRDSESLNLDPRPSSINLARPFPPVASPSTLNTFSPSQASFSRSGSATVRVFPLSPHRIPYRTPVARATTFLNSQLIYKHEGEVTHRR